MGFSDDIRTIARTKELEEKIAKAVKTANDALKASINSSRSMATQSGDNSKGIQTGAPGGSDAVVGTLPSGAQQSLPPNGTQVPSNRLSGNFSTSDSNTNSDLASATDRLNNGNNTDLSSHAKIGGSGASGSEALNIGEGGAGDTVLSALITKMQADGIPIAEQQRFVDDYLAKKFEHKGEKPAAAVADKSANSPTTQFTSDQQLYYPGSNLGKETLNSIIGFAKDGAISTITGKPLGVKVNLKGQYPTPNSTDIASRYPPQDSWDDANSPPILQSFDSGLVWTLISGITQLFDQTFYGLINQREAIGPTKAYSIVGGFVSSLTPSPEDLIQFSSNLSGTIGMSSAALGGTQYAFTIYNPTSTIPISHYGQQDCGLDLGDTVTCLLPAPRETAWPQTGLIAVTLLNGLFKINDFDSEAPFGYRPDTSSIRIAIGNGIDVIDGRFLDIQLGVQGGYLMSTVNADGTTIENVDYYDANGVLTLANIPPTNVDNYRPPR